MAFIINNSVIGDKLARHLGKARAANQDSIEKLSSGKIFTTGNPHPSERALAEGLEFRLRSLSASKRNINDAVSLLQTAESGLSEINNIMIRMKEINVTGASSTMSDKERYYLFIEYEALHDEINRIAQTTEFNGMPLLNGDNESAPEALIFNVGDYQANAEEGEELNLIRFDGFKEVAATTMGLGLKSAFELLENAAEDGISLEDATELMVPDEGDETNTYEQALNRLSTHRAVFGAMQSRLNRAMDYNDVFAENIAAAKSKIADTDYAKEVTRLAENNILIQATTSLMAQNNVNSQMALGLVGSILGR